MKGLVLEGGGAKGAYEAGAIKALQKKKIYFDGVSGTSIGAINAAFYAERNLTGLYKLWESTDSSELFGIDGEFLNNISHLKFKKSEIKKNKESIKSVIKNFGIDTKNIRILLNKYIKEDRIRKSKVDFVLVTFNINDLKPVVVHKNDIPKGKIQEYIMASAYLPGFKFEKIIDNKYYIDGGVYDRCPVNELIDSGYDEIFVIKAWQNKLKYKKKPGIKIHEIKPRENLGSVLVFTKEVSTYRMNLGYFDTLKYLNNLDGKKYYFKHYSDKYYDNLFDKISYKKIIKKYNNNIVPKSNKDFIIKIIEKVCKELNIERFKIYNTPYLLTKLKYKMIEKRENYYYDFIKNIKVDFE